jgi:hypothetical protein
MTGIAKPSFWKDKTFNCDLSIFIEKPDFLNIQERLQKEEKMSNTCCDVTDFLQKPDDGADRVEGML